MASFNLAKVSFWGQNVLSMYCIELYTFDCGHFPAKGLMNEPRADAGVSTEPGRSSGAWHKLMLLCCCPVRSAALASVRFAHSPAHAHSLLIKEDNPSCHPPTLCLWTNTLTIMLMLKVLITSRLWRHVGGLLSTCLWVSFVLPWPNVAMQNVNMHRVPDICSAGMWTTVHTRTHTKQLALRQKQVPHTHNKL